MFRNVFLTFWTKSLLKTQSVQNMEYLTSYDFCFFCSHWARKCFSWNLWFWWRYVWQICMFQGICGNPCVMDIGGEAYLTPSPNMEKVAVVSVFYQSMCLLANCYKSINLASSVYMVLCRKKPLRIRPLYLSQSSKTANIKMLIIYMREIYALAHLGLSLSTVTFNIGS